MCESEGSWGISVPFAQFRCRLGTTSKNKVNLKGGGKDVGAAGLKDPGSMTCLGCLPPETPDCQGKQAPFVPGPAAGCS